MKPEVFILLSKEHQLNYLNKHQNHIIYLVCKSIGIDLDELNSKSRKGNIPRARALCAYFLRENTFLTLDQIGDLLGGKDHSTILHYIQKVESRKYDVLLNKMYKVSEVAVSEYINNFKVKLK